MDMLLYALETEDEATAFEAHAAEPVIFDSLLFEPERQAA